MQKEENNLLNSWARDFGITLSTSQINLINIYLNELWEWNKKVNLTGLTSRKKILKELLIDSLIPSPYLPEEGNFLDVGSGAGFPAIPLKISSPGLKTHLMEARSKRVNFLKQVIRITNLDDIEIIRGRIEKDGTLLRSEGYDIITARALADLPRTLTWCAPHLKTGGLILSFQASQLEKVLKEGSDVIHEHGLVLYKTVSYRLPGKDSIRHLLIFRKTKL
ncbi:MAG: 16S rRNA (guanine(527)-N(7))-methyltransferase RsmG [Deltaproteobacteria bacterium]|nr:16S rRNA (guanine(527)-N(7))-methyltransferase RsmG [Deltaproteobacteria bacterium]MBW2343845.1 16S rRNA (guanine(527)-N(7))-methyltransferase RsmG [Deltaproteobacteria bacterium]